MLDIVGLQEKLREKDRLINQLRKENLKILQNALQQSQENTELKERIEELQKNNL